MTDAITKVKKMLTERLARGRVVGARVNVNCITIRRPKFCWASRPLLVRGRGKGAIQLKQWKRGQTMYRELKALGASDDDARRAAANSRCWWVNSAKRLNRVMPIAYFDRLGVPRLS